MRGSNCQVGLILKPDHKDTPGLFFSLSLFQQSTYMKKFNNLYRMFVKTFQWSKMSKTNNITYKMLKQMSYKKT